MDESSQDSGQLLDNQSNGHENDSEQMIEIEGDDHEIEGDFDAVIVDTENGISQGKDYPPPVVGMEFESYDDAYNYYNCHAKEVGFAIRVKSSWTKRNSKEKRGAVLCCNCEGFKTMKEANSRRRETRTGCLAMIRLRLVESGRWRVDEVKLEHNHLFDPERAQNSKSHKKMDAGAKRKLEHSPDIEVRTIKLYRTLIVDSGSYGCSNSNERENISSVDQSKHLKLKSGDAQVLYNYFCRAQLTNPHFFYSIDLNDEGKWRNVFWIDSWSRAACRYFGDVVAFDSTCLSKKYKIPLVAFVGQNHHSQSVLLGCGLLADQSMESYIWFFRSWLTCMSGRPPHTIITEQCRTLRAAILEVFPRAHHRLSLSDVLHSITERLGESQESETFQMILNKVVYHSIKVEDFELAWEDMIQKFGLKDDEWLQTLYEDRERWVPVYVKDTFWAGMSSARLGDPMCSIFYGYMHSETSLNEFFEIYRLVLQKKHQKEILDDFESRDSCLVLKTRCNYELQLSKVYTKEVFKAFQEEVEMMANCFSIAQVHIDGSTIAYIVKEREAEGSFIRSFEVMYDKAGQKVCCICGCFNLKGYLCCHALCVLSYNGVEEVPLQYILSRWRKDFKRLYIPGLGSNNIDITNPVQWFDHLYRQALQVVEEGMISQDHYMVAWQAFKESLNKVRLVGASMDEK
ncbi:MULE transposase domain [Dillenia turbinata]|uniref:Protein FAR1-RELATED SEQUENCE n=1 Tax=Dillenia turbinata TaxID=194707 RepID=A0AAN8UKM6_9MAGN